MGSDAMSLSRSEPRQSGQIRMDTEHQVMARIMSLHLDTESSRAWWGVQPILGGEPYLLSDTKIGTETYNEMEAIAWAATQ